MHVSVGVHIGHAASANFYSSPVKKLMQFVIRRKMSKRFKNNLPIFVFVFKLNGGFIGECVSIARIL